MNKVLSAEKVCITCGVSKPRTVEYFYASPSYADKLQTECKPCVIIRAARNRKDLQTKRAGRPKPNVCEVCGRGGKIVWDHCHASGDFRGWLCDDCNVALGRIRDNPLVLRALAEYLERSA